MFRVALALAAVLTAGLWGIPLLLSSDTVRNQVVNRPLQGLGVEATTEAGSFGWFPPTRVEGLDVVSPDQSVDVTADEVRIDQPWWRLVLDPEQLGHVDVENPSVTLRVQWGELDEYSLTELPAFTARLRHADFKLRLVKMNDAVIDIGGLNVDLNVNQDGGQSGGQDGGSYLTIEPGRIFDHQRLTPEVCDDLLQLMDPTLGGVVSVEGSFSLDVLRLRVPLDVSPSEQLQQVDFRGILHLHEVTTRAKSPLLRRILRVATQHYGKAPTETMHVVQDNEVQVAVREGRLYHDQLVLSLPQISPDLNVRIRGSVGLNETLDLTLVLPETLVDGTPADGRATTDAPAVARYHVGGTVSQPELTRMTADDSAATAAGG